MGGDGDGDGDRDRGGDGDGQEEGVLREAWAGGAQLCRVTHGELDAAQGHAGTAANLCSQSLRARCQRHV